MDNSHQNSRETNQPYTPELDLFEFIKGLYAEKLAFVYSTVFTLAVGILYLYMSSPIYIAKAQLLPPHPADIQAMEPLFVARPDSELFLYTPNAPLRQQQQLVDLIKRTADGEGSQNQTKVINAERVFSSFLEQLLSQSHIYNMATTNEKLIEDAFKLKINNDLIKEIKKSRWIEFSDTEKKTNNLQPDSYILSITGYDRASLEKLLLQDLTIASKATIEETRKYYTNQLERLLIEAKGKQLLEIASLDNRANARKDYLFASRQEKIIQLEEKINIAEQLKSEETLGLKLQLKQLKNRDKNTFIDEDLRSIYAQKKLIENAPHINQMEKELNRIQNQEVSISFFNEAFDIPERPIKPQKMNTLLIAIGAGFILGLAIAIVNVFRKRLANES